MDVSNSSRTFLRTYFNQCTSPLNSYNCAYQMLYSQSYNYTKLGDDSLKLCLLSAQYSMQQ